MEVHNDQCCLYMSDNMDETKIEMASGQEVSSCNNSRTGDRTGGTFIITYLSI